MKSRKRIICDNLFTLFNFLNFAIAGLLFAVGAYKNMLFLGVIILNIIIGTAQELVKVMKRQGHQVAMTGDGVNDLLALREADCSIAVADGSDASRQVAQVVLLESDFTQLPQVVMEGRRVVNNVTRTAGVFFIKTIYSLLVSFLCLALNMPFPFIPIQITLVDACMEAYPSFLTILEAHTEKIRGKFLPTALGNALPYGIAVSAMVAAVSLTSSFGQPQTQTVMYLLLILISMVAVFRSCIPINPLRLFICVTNVIGTFGALLILPDLFSVSAVTMPMALYIAGALAGSFAVIAAFEDPLEKGLKGQIPNHHWWETYLSNTYWTVLLIGVLVCFGLILVLLVVSYISTKRLNRMIMKPVNALVAGAERIRDGNLEEPIEYKGEMEFENVCLAFNVMQNRILADRKQQRERRIEAEQGRQDSRG